MASSRRRRRSRRSFPRGRPAFSATRRAKAVWGNPQALGEPAAVDDGDGILGHVLGSKDASREVATRAAAQTGTSADVLKRMLPLAATMLMGALARRSGGTTASGLAGGGGLAAMLGPLLDSNRAGSIVDDVTGALGKFLGRS